MNLLVLTYHYFHDERPYGIKAEDHPFSMNVDRFESHLRQLNSSGLEIVDPTKAENGEWPPSNAPRQVMITIDDGHRSFGDLAVDKMIQHKIPAVLPVIAGQVGQTDYLDWSALRYMATVGFSIQSHSMTHVNLARLTEDQCHDELRRSKETIEDQIGAPVTMLAAPMGRINRRVSKCAAQIGYSLIMTSYTGINTEPDDLKLMKRFQVKSHMDKLPLDDYYKPLSSLRLIGSAKNMVKRLRDGWR